MRRWFLSYHSPDQALAERVKAELERKDTDARVFFAPASLRAGGFWSKALADEIAQADAFILLVGETGVGNWQVLEYGEALDKRVNVPNFPVILVLLQGQTAPGLPFLRRLHWIITPDPSSEKDVARLLDAASGKSTRPGELWRYTSPYRGLAAMEEQDSDYFFGREHETVDALSVLAAATDRLPVLLGNSGVGKSSLAQAGVLAALKRQAWPEGADKPPAWPHAFRESRRWCFLTLKPGTEPLKALVESFLDTWQLGATDPERVKQQNGWIVLLRDGKATLRDLLDATERRYKELDRGKPPAFFLYVDQGEELYVRAEEHQRRRFSEVIAQGVADPRVCMLMSMRADFLGELQKDEPLYKVRLQLDVPPLRETALREVVSRPAEPLSARFETAGLVDVITRRAAEDSVKDVGALPLLSYSLDDMWTQMVKRGDGVLRLPAQSFELGGVLVDRADAFLANHAMRMSFAVSSPSSWRPCASAKNRRDVAQRGRSLPMRSGVSSASSPITPTGCSSRQHPMTAKPMPRWRTRRCSGAGTSYATGSPPSANFSPGRPGSRPRAGRGRKLPTRQRATRCSWGRR
jgi:hypothetical protein